MLPSTARNDEELGPQSVEVVCSFVIAVPAGTQGFSCMELSAVCLVGLLPAPNITGPTLVRHLLQPLSADLFVVTQSKRALAHAPALAHYSKLRGVAGPSVALAGDAGGSDVHIKWWSYGTLAFISHHEVCLQLVQGAEQKRCTLGDRRHACRYHRIVLTRGDFYWLQDHPALSALHSRYIWTPSRFAQGGVNDRHAVLNRSAANVYLQVRIRMGSAGFNLSAHRTWTSERAVAAVLQGIEVRGFPFAAHHVVPSERKNSALGGVSPWGLGSGANVKWLVSEAAQRSLGAAPEGCHVAKTAAYSSEDVLHAHAAAACLAGAGLLAPLCGPHGPPTGLPQRFSECQLEAPRFTARFLAEGMGKPGLAGLELLDAARKASAGTGERGDASGSLARAVMFLSQACKRQWVCERGRGENAFSVHCPVHFCGALVEAQVAAGRLAEAQEISTWVQRTRPFWGLVSADAGPLECGDLPAFFGLRTIIFQDATYCLAP